MPSNFSYSIMKINLHSSNTQPHYTFCFLNGPKFSKGKLLRAGLRAPLSQFH